MGSDVSKETGEVSSPPVAPASPRPSICSDADIPYISYTVNRPIGDSPKHSLNSPKRRRRIRGSSQRPPQIVVVSEARSTTEEDAEMARLQTIPSFLPIMRGALTAPFARDPEILERLNSEALLGLCRRYQVNLHSCATTVSASQDVLIAKIKEIDSCASNMMTLATERQKAFARHAEKLSQVTEVAHSLSRCHSSLNHILESLDTLNNLLPVHERLEPFVWTTGER